MRLCDLGVTSYAVAEHRTPSMKTFPSQAIRVRFLRAALRQWRWHWLGLAALTGITLVVVILDDYVPFNLDPILLILYGVIIPFVALWMLDALAGTLAESAKSEETLAEHQRFTQQLEHCQDFSELTHFILNYAASLLPINHTSLFVYEHRRAQMQFVAEWNSDGRQSAAVGRYVASTHICNTCLITKSPQLRHMGACVAMFGLAGEAGAVEYCQPLIYDNLLVGVLRFQCKPGQTFAQERIDYLNSIAPELALALALSLAQPQQLTQVQLNAQLEERRSLAYDLHNSLAQQASYLHLALERILHDRNVVMADDVRQDLLEMRVVALDMYDEIRNDLAQLRLHPTNDLISAITHYARSVAGKAGLEIELKTYGEPIALSPFTTQQIVELLREGLTNIKKHAVARRAQIALTWSLDSLTITLADDGVGFDPEAVSEGHYGLIMMAERAADLGGVLDIDSTCGGGTRLIFQFALSLLQAKTSIWPSRLISQYEES